MLDVLCPLQGLQKKVTFTLGCTEGECPLPSTYEEDAWVRIREVLDAEFDKSPSPYSREEVYQDMEDLCLSGSSPFLYVKIRQYLDQRASSFVETIEDAYRRICGSSLGGADYPRFSGAIFSIIRPGTRGLEEPLAFARWLNAAWMEFSSSLMTVRQILMPLDRSYVVGLPIDNTEYRDVGGVLANPALRSLYDMGVALLQFKLRSMAHIVRACGLGVAESLRRARLEALAPFLPRLNSDADADVATGGATVSISEGNASSSGAVSAPEEKANPAPCGDFLLQGLSQMLVQVGHYEMALHQTPLLLTPVVFRSLRAVATEAWSAPQDYVKFIKLCTKALAVEADLWAKRVASGGACTRTADSVGATAFRNLVVCGLDLLQGAGFSWVLREALASAYADECAKQLQRAEKPLAVDAPSQPQRPPVPASGKLSADEALDCLAQLHALLERASASRAFFRGSGSAQILNVAKEFVEAAGEEDKDAETMSRLIMLRRFLDTIMRHVFGSGSDAAQAARQAQNAVMSSGRPGRFAEALAKHVDVLLRRGFSSNKRAGATAEGPPASDSASPLPSVREFVAKLDDAFLIFQKIPCKDVFEALYKRDLAKRFLLGTAKMSLEKLAVDQMKAECGPGFTLHIEGMFNDVITSNNLNKIYRSLSPGGLPSLSLPLSSSLPLSLSSSSSSRKRHAEAMDVDEGAIRNGLPAITGDDSSTSEGAPSHAGLPGPSSSSSLSASLDPSPSSLSASLDPGIGATGAGAATVPLSPKDVFVHVITFGFWPTQPRMSINLPKELELSQERFESFYLERFPNRRLQWLQALGSCVLGASFPEAPKELIVSIAQTAVLMLFNVRDRMTFSTIKSLTGMEDKELRCTLQSLACAKTRVLQKEPRGHDVKDNDEFLFNHAFSDGQFRIQINAVEAQTSEDDNRRVKEDVAIDREQRIDAAVVRIVKSRRRISHTDLVARVADALPFPVEPAKLKRRIEALIEREYLERDQHEGYVYVA